MNSAVDTENWYQEYKDRANFLMVYIEEAHPGGVKDGIEIHTATSMDEKEQLAELCTISGNLSLPTVLDKLDNAVEIAYAAWPDRIYVVDADGIIRDKTKPGPSGWEFSGSKAVLDRLLAGTSRASDD